MKRAQRHAVDKRRASSFPARPDALHLVLRARGTEPSSRRKGGPAVSSSPMLPIVQRRELTPSGGDGDANDGDAARALASVN
ncbi:hypothetical protein MTO96_011566 [Rhipicephalus appendiculatus]